MCFPQGAWSHCGSVRGTTAATVFDCAGPGVVDPSGLGVWVQSKFNLAGFLGQRIRVRWVAGTWMFQPADSYYEMGGGWATTQNDDGWWLDNIQFKGTITAQLTPTPDTRPAPATACPATAADNCNENTAASDKGTNPQLKVTDLSGNVIDGLSLVATYGQALRVTAIDSSLPGACTGGVAQFRFSKNGSLAQDWSAKSYFQDAPETDSTYNVQVRCSSDFTCTSLTGANASVKVNPGDGSEIALSVSHDRATGTTTLSWPSRPQIAPLAGYDAFRGTQADDGSASTANTPDSALASLTSLSCDLAQVLPLGTTLSVTTTATVPANTAHYYLVGHSNPTAGSRTALGRGVNNTVRVAPIACP
jgi:hypothetical protein